MKKKPAASPDSKEKSQINIGYENTEVRTDTDKMEDTRAQTTKVTGKKALVENKKDSAGLRSESGKKTMAKKAGNLEKGD
ncbi:MAG: hypothetical protein ABI151_03455 [Chitinophagaceae bacterium]